MVVAAPSHRVAQQPTAIRVLRDSRLGETFVQGDDGFNLLFAGQDAALELEITKSVACVRGLGQPHDGPRVHCRLMAQAQPVVLGIWFAAVRQIGAGSITHVKQITEHVHRVALLAFAQ